MKRYSATINQALTVMLVLMPGLALGFNSGSTGADGAFNPTVNTQLLLPPSGIFNFTSVNIPSGVTVTFTKNTTNTPVTMLASGDVTIAGILDVSGTSSTNVGAAGDGNLGDDGVPGVGGPGGYDGGRGGVVIGNAGTGLGPGGGGPGTYGVISICGTVPCAQGGGGGGFGATGSNNSFTTNTGNNGLGGASYGSSLLLPLIGGSGGGGGAGGANFGGSGGGGGGGAIVIASSGTVNVTGSLLAKGGKSGDSAGANCGATGGGGSGGGIRIIATTIAGNGTISANNGTNSSLFCSSFGGSGAVGIIRLESETFTRTAATTPPYTTGTPSTVFVAGLPTLTISSVAGVPAPAAPTGNADITLPASTPNPVTVVFTTTGVPVGNTVKLTVTPAAGVTTSVISPALTGSTASATASVNVSLSSGPSVLSATTTYTIVASLGDMLAPYAMGERVEKITVVAVPGQPNRYILITVSGKEFEVQAAVLASGG